MDTTKAYNYEDYALRRGMSANVVGFCRFMRSQGLRTGIGEQMDALRSLEQINLRQKEPFRLALRTTLAKSSAEQELFDKHFRSFWYVWESAEELLRGNPEERLKSTVRLIDERQRGPSFLSISD